MLKFDLPLEGEHNLSMRAVCELVNPDSVVAFEPVDGDQLIAKDKGGFDTVVRQQVLTRVNFNPVGASRFVQVDFDQSLSF